MHQMVPAAPARPAPATIFGQPPLATELPPPPPPDVPNVSDIGAGAFVGGRSDPAGLGHMAPRPTSTSYSGPQEQSLAGIRAHARQCSFGPWEVRRRCVVRPTRLSGPVRLRDALPAPSVGARRAPIRRGVLQGRVPPTAAVVVAPQPRADDAAPAPTHCPLAVFEDRFGHPRPSLLLRSVEEGLGAQQPETRDTSPRRVGKHR